MIKRIHEEPQASEITQDHITVSDGVVLNLIDFKPIDGSQKPILLFVAGWLSNLSGWHNVLNEITPHFRVLYLESREKRSATLPPGPLPRFDIDRMADDIAEVVAARIPRETPLYVAGSSLGSTALIRAMSRQLLAPVAAFLISPVTAFQFPGWGNFIIRFFPPSFFTVIRYPIVWYLVHFRVDRKKEPEQVQKYTETVMGAEPRRLKANAGALSGHTVWGDLDGVKSPVVIIGAASDKLHGMDEITRMVEKIPEARMEVMVSNKETHSEKAGRFILKGMEGHWV